MILSISLVSEPVMLGFAGDNIYAYAVENESAGETGGDDQQQEDDSQQLVLEKPGNFALKLSNTRNITVTWNGVKNAKGYQVLRSSATSDWKTIKTISASASNNTYSFTNYEMAYNKLYYYKIKAYAYDENSNKIESVTDVKSIRTGDPYISAPAIKSLTVSGSGIKYQWYSVKNASKYEVYRKKDGDSSYTKIATTSNTSYLDDSVGSRIKYYYKVRAVSATKADNKSNFSNVYSRYSYLYRPSPWLNDRGTSFIKLKWDFVPRATYYNVYRWYNSGWRYLGKTTGRTFKTTWKLSAGTRAVYQVEAVRVENGKKVAIRGSKDFVAATRLKATSKVTVTGRTPSTASIKWEPIPKATRYSVYLSRDGLEAWKVYDGTETSLKLNDLYQAKDYTVTVYGYTYIKGAYTYSYGNSKTVLSYKNNNFAVLGLSSKKFLENLNKHRYDGYYIGTPYRSLQDIKSESSLTRPNGYKSSYKKGMNCAGFIATAFKDAGADLTLIRSYGYSVGAANACNWVNFFNNSGVEVYRYSSMKSLLKYGRAEMGDIICRVPHKFDAKKKHDYHMAIFWGNSPSHNRVWHSTIQGGRSANQISAMPSVDYDCTYMLVKLKR